MFQSPTIVVIAYHSGDVERTKLLLDWIKQLGGVKPNPILLVADEIVSMDTRQEVARKAKESSDYVITISNSVKAAWPPNSMLLSAAKWISECAKLPWLWLEPDAVPLKEGWLDAISEEYEASPMKFLGPIVEQKNQPGLPARHLTGTAVYPPDAWSLYSGRKPLFDQITAWDIESAAAVIPRSKFSNTISHYWGTKDLPPHFVEKKTEGDPANFVTLDFIPKQAYLFHRTKTDGLIKILRKQLSKKPTAPQHN